MKLLILGGTQFVGRTLTEIALSRGHEVTLFNRGNTNADLFPEVEKLQGDRASDLSELEGRSWDAVIDTCGYVPRVVKMSAEMLADKVQHYTFISSISVYASEQATTANSIDEDFPLAELEDESTEEITGGSYGGLKVLCERAAEAAMPGRVLTIRPGLIVGPYDHTDRFSYWPVMTQRLDTLVAPPEDAPIKVIDARDLAEFTLDMVEAKETGIYHATGPDYDLNFGEVLQLCTKVVAEQAAEIVHVSEEFLKEQEIQPWGDLPLWLPSDLAGMTRIDVSKAVAAGLKFRPLEETMRDLLAWFSATHDADTALKAGLSPEKQAELLAAWREKVQ